MAKQAQRTAVILLGLIILLLAACIFCLYGMHRNGAGPALSPAVLSPVSGYALVDLNRAGEKELCSLPGIGEVLAQRIIEHRETEGLFRSREDVLSVSGIGKSTFERIEPYITFEAQDGNQ